MRREKGVNECFTREPRGLGRKVKQYASVGFHGDKTGKHVR